MSRGKADTPTSDYVRLDKDFKKNIEDIKPFVLKLEAKQKEVIATWIKKLCSASITTPTERKNRNLYVQILAQMLRRGNIKEPFNKVPDPGKLPTIPAYMSKYLGDEPEESESTMPKQVKIPEWLEEDYLDESLFSYSVLHESYQKYKDVLTPRKREKFMLPTVASSDHLEIPELSNIADLNATKDSIDHTFLEGIESISPHNTSSPEILMQKRTSAKQEYKERFSKKLSSTTKYTNGTRSEQTERFSNLLDSTIESQMELKVKKLETKFQEENLKLQQEHDHMVKKILDRKNREMDEMKSYYSSKISELENNVKKEKKKGDVLLKENKDMKLIHTKESEQMRDAVERRTANTAAEYEKLMFDKLADFEREMFELQKNHRFNIRELLEEAENKMTEMKSAHHNEMKVLKESTVLLTQELHDFKNRVNELKTELKRSKEIQEDKSKQIKELRSEVAAKEKSCQEMEASKSKVVKEYEKSVRQLRSKSEQTIDELKKQREESTQKTTTIVSDLESQIGLYRQTIQDMEMQHKRDLLEKSTDHQQQLVETNIRNEKESRLAETEHEKKELDYQSRINRYEYAVKERDATIVQLQAKLDEHTEASEKMIERFRVQAEENSNKIFEELTSKLERLQTSLTKAREKIEEQKNTFNGQYSRLKQDHEKKVTEMQIGFDEEKSRILEKHTQETELLTGNHKKELESALFSKESFVEAIESKYKSQNTKNEKTIGSLEHQIKVLQEQVLDSNTLRQTQLREVGQLRDEEKRNCQKSEEALHSKYKSEIEKLRYNLQSQQNEQMTAYTEKMNARLRELEGEYTKKLTVDKSKITTLQSKLSDINKELFIKTNCMEEKMQSLAKKSDEEKQNVEQKLKNEVKRTRDELETQLIKFKQLEKKYKTMDMSYQEKISKFLLESEDKMKGLLPLSVQKDLEETIGTMKEQITILKLRADILQEELQSSTNTATSTIRS